MPTKKESFYLKKSISTNQECLLDMSTYEIINDSDRDVSWFQEANCKGQTDIMFPENYSDRLVVSAAKAICASCLVRKECLDFAIDNNELFGIYGGKTPRERSRMQTIKKNNNLGNQQ